MENSKATVPSAATFVLTLSKLIKGDWVLKDANCQFTYKWDFQTNTGTASLDSINGSTINITLNAEGLAGYLAFLSDISPTRYDVNGKSITIFRVSLRIQLSDNKREALIMFNEDGSTVEATSNVDGI